MLSPEESSEAIAALSAAGLNFTEAGPDGSGCAGPTLVMLRFADEDGLQERIDAALEGL